MADHHHRDATTPQRKRVAVACSRCRKRRIRCSGDPGDGLPCSTCKNAGVEQCRFLRVASREAPIRLDTGDPFGYPVSIARLFHAGRGGPAPPSLLGSHQQDTLPYSSTLSEVAATSYGHRRGSLAGYSYGGGATKPTSYYPMSPTTAYHSAYGDEYADHGMDVHSQSVMCPVEAVSAAATPWPPVRAKTSTHNFSDMFTLDPETSTYTSYPTSALVHRPSTQAVFPVSHVDCPAPFSFTNATSLPKSSDRLLPNPTVRAATLPYPSGLEKSTSNGASSSGLGLTDMASAAGNYASSYEYSSHGPESSSRPNSDGHSYGGSSSQPESMFSDNTQSALSSQEAAFDSMSGSSSCTSTTGGHDSPKGPDSRE
ncbi:hypothetical protein QBC35DRAFT_392352 [Podospora australis]|uniref:Zn(2)-C6 fungal-type domain-containing protein n=1 Tax=Podospora australis TaxID=1536484 RepID=A0AAN6WPP2_9PEZI|nr:hypothetical protein QBC35DRAFT_392352 [Podospora australis]